MNKGDDSNTNTSFLTEAEVYAAVIELLVHAETISWSRFNNFLVAHALLIAAWATVYGQLSENGDKFLPQIFLFSICVVGVIICFPWIYIAKRSRGYVDTYLQQGKQLEARNSSCDVLKPLTEAHKEDNHGTTMPSDVSTSRFLHAYTPCLFAMLYAVMFVVTLGRN